MLKVRIIADIEKCGLLVYEIDLDVMILIRDPDDVLSTSCRGPRMFGGYGPLPELSVLQMTRLGRGSEKSPVLRTGLLRIRNARC